MELTERSGGVASWGERLTRISSEVTDVKRVVVVVVVVVGYLKRCALSITLACNDF